MQEQSWVLGHLDWLIGALVLPPVGYFGNRLLHRWTAKRVLSPVAIDPAPDFSGVLPERRTSLPTADDLQDAYNLVSVCYRADLLRNYVGLDVCWPGILVGACASPEVPEYAYAQFRFDGDRTNGALFRCRVKLPDYPGIDATKEREAKAWVQGKIAGIDDSCITLTKSIVEFQ